MKLFLCGLAVGLGLAGTIALAGDLYDRKGNPAAPSGLIQQYDYYRQRQQQLDIGAMRREADRQRLEHQGNPCPTK